MLFITINSITFVSTTTKNNNIMENLSYTFNQMDAAQIALILLAFAAYFMICLVIFHRAMVNVWIVVKHYFAGIYAIYLMHKVSKRD
jgi:4-hydroxybenzoate polyprenyltransferase